jgi:hypothetical protein
MTESFNRKLGRLAQNVSGTGSITSNAATASAWQTARTITLGGDLSGSVSIDGSSNVSLTATVSGDAVVLGTDTSGNYVATIAAGSGISVSGSGSETAAVTVSIDNTVATLTGEQTLTNKTLTTPVISSITNTGTLTLPTSTDTLVGRATSDTLTNKTISGSNNTISNIGNGSLTNSSITVNGTSIALGASGTLVTDDIAEDGSPVNLWYTDTRSRAAISVTDSGGDGSLSYNSGSGVITYTGPSASEVRAHFSAGTGVAISSGQISIGQAVATTDNVTFAGVTADNIRVGVTGANEIDTSSGNLTIDSTGGTTVMDDDVNVTGNLLVDGNLTVSGTTVTVNTTNLAVEDNMIYLNNGSVVTNPDLGFAGNYNDGTYRHAGVFRDASDGVWKFFHQYTPEPDASAYIDITHGSFALASVQASSFTGSLTGNVTGNASTATAWQTARTLSLTGDVTGTSAAFDGSGNISITTTIAANSVALGTDTTGDYVASVAVAGTGLSVAGSGENATYTITSNATSANTVSTIVARDASGNFTAGTITAALSGNATTASSISGFNNPTTASTANTIAYRTSLGDIAVRELILEVGVQSFTPSSMVAIYPTTNQAVKVDAAGARNFLDVPTRSGGNASGSWGISITGNSATTTILNSVNTTSTSTSTWNPQSLTYQAWGQSFTHSSISGDSGDLVLWLRSSQYGGGGTELCMIIDGDYFAGVGQYKVLHAGNYGSYALPLSGGTVTGATTFSAQSVEFGNGGSNSGIGIYHGNGSGDYGRIRFYQAGSNNQTIHAFPTTWQGGNLNNASAGAINFDGANGVTFGAWNNIGASIDKSGNTYIKGNVGIGTTSPQTKLHVWTGTTGPSVEALRLTGAYGAAGDGPLLRFTNYLSYATNPNSGEYNLAAIRALDFASAWGGALQFQTATNVSGGGTLTTAMTIDPSQNVGIGTTSPSLRLSLGTTTGRKFMVYDDGGGANEIGGGMGVDLGGFSAETSIFFGNYGGSGRLSIGAWTSSQTYSTKMTVLASGNVGIGTTSPANKLHLNGGKFIFTSDDGSYGQLQVNAPSGGEATILFSSTGSGQNSGGYTNIGVIGIGAYGYSRDVLVLGTGYSGATMFLKSGNVGIGTASPIYKLHVNGTSYFADTVNFGAGTNSVVSWTTGYSDGTTLIIRGPDAGSLILQPNTSYTGIFIKSNGNVGIGTTSPNALLDLGTSGTSFASGHMISWGISERQERKTGVMRLNSGLMYLAYNHGQTTHPTTEEGFTSFLRQATSYRTSGITTTVNAFTLSADNYFVEFFGYLFVDTARVYYFNTNADDATDMFIDGKRVADYYGGHGPSNNGNRGGVYLHVGYHKLYARFEEIGGGDEITLQWSTDGGASYAVIPAANLFHGPEDALFAISNTAGINVMGDIVATGNITAYGSPSDATLKENVQPINNALNVVTQLQGVTFDWKKDTNSYQLTKIDKDIGFIAQDVQKIVPSIVRENEDGLLSLRDKAIIPLLVEAIKEQQQEIQELKNRLNKLQ